MSTLFDSIRFDGGAMACCEPGQRAIRTGGCTAACVCPCEVCAGSGQLDPGQVAFTRACCRHSLRIWRQALCQRTPGGSYDLRLRRCEHGTLWVSMVNLRPAVPSPRHSYPVLASFALAPGCWRAALRLVQGGAR